MTYEELVARVGEDRYRAACEWAWQTAAGTGVGIPDRSPDDLADVPHELSDLWYDETTTLENKLDLGLRLYSERPSYATLMNFVLNFGELDERMRQRMWAAFRDALESEDDRIADPVGYLLWVDFFEDARTAPEAWREMTLRDSRGWERRLRRVLVKAGPVAWNDKQTLFEELALEPPWHPYILSAIVGSAFDAFGQIDVPAARRWLDDLSLDVDAHGLKELREKLGSPA